MRFLGHHSGGGLRTGSGFVRGSKGSIPLPYMPRLSCPNRPDLRRLVPVLTVEEEIERGAARRDPAAARLRRKAAILAASSWPPPELVASLGVEAAYKLLDGASKAHVDRERVADPEQVQAQRRRDQANDYSNAIVAWMREHRPATK
jgi:hypothetical protein